MDWKQMADRAKEVVDERGGPQSVKEDAEELRDIVAGQGALTEKLGRAAKAIKEPGAHHDPAAETQPGASGTPPSAGDKPDAAFSGGDRGGTEHDR